MSVLEMKEELQQFIKNQQRSNDKMKNLLFLLFFFMLSSCTTENEIKNIKVYFKSGKLKSLTRKKNNTVLNYFEYYKTGEMYLNKNFKKKYYYYYYKNGKIKQKAEFSKNKKYIWKFNYDTLSNIVSATQYYIKRKRKTIDKDTFFVNQKIYYHENKAIDKMKSVYFNIEEKDTIYLGRNAVSLNYYDNRMDTVIKYNPKRFMKIIIDNHYSNVKIKKDTFYFKDKDYNNGIVKAFFGVYAYKTGNLIIEGMIDDLVIYAKKISKDSVQSIESRERAHFIKYFFVKDTVDPSSRTNNP